MAKNGKHVKLRMRTMIGDWEKEFPRSAKIKEVIGAIIRHFDLAKSGHYALKLERKPETGFILSRSLNRYKIKNGDVFILEIIGVMWGQTVYSG